MRLISADGSLHFDAATQQEEGRQQIQLVEGENKKDYHALVNMLGSGTASSAICLHLKNTREALGRVTCLNVRDTDLMLDLGRSTFAR